MYYNIADTLCIGSICRHHQIFPSTGSVAVIVDTPVANIVMERRTEAAGDDVLRGTEDE